MHACPSVALSGPNRLDFEDTESRQVTRGGNQALQVMVYLVNSKILILGVANIRGK